MMTKIGPVILLTLLAAPVAFGQRQQLMELQRDMALLQDEVRGMNERLTNLTVMVEQLMDRVNNTNTTVTVLDSSIKDSLAKQREEIAAPVATLGAKVDRMSDEFRFVRESVSDLNSRVGQIQTQVSDLKTTMQIMSAPPAPPPGDPAAPPAGGYSSPPAGSMTAPAMSAETLYNNARRDQSGGKLDLALMQYQDFLKNFPNSNLAPSAQFGVGEIHYSKGEYDAAVEAFDLVLEKYPENNRTADAMLMKAQSLVQAGDKRRAAVEYRNLIKRYPDAPVAERAREELAKFGF